MEGVFLGGATLLATFALEGIHNCYTIGTVSAPSKTLYRTAVWKNIINNGIIGPVTWQCIVPFCQLRSTVRGMEVIALLLVHAIGYYIAHRAMHHRCLFRFHALHHEFRNVSPMAANCVSTAEYLMAYMLPFFCGALLLRPDPRALKIAVGWISVANLLIHMPLLERVSKTLKLLCIVSTSDHMEHHLTRSGMYAAPTLAVDRILQLLQSRSN